MMSACDPSEHPSHQRVGIFRHLARLAADGMGTSWAFMVAIATVLTWVITGPFFSYSDTWQLFINTGTTIVTFLMVFLIQNAQNRDSLAVHLKLDELLRAVHEARNDLVSLEDRSDNELANLRAEFAAISAGSTSADTRPPKLWPPENSSAAAS